MTEYWIWLSQIPYIGPVTANRLLQMFDSPGKLYQAEPDELAKACALSPRQVASVIQNRSLDAAYRIMEQCCRHEIRIITQLDERYPSKAKVRDAPILLYYKGELTPLSRSVAIVGARRCTRDARDAAIERAREAAEGGTAVVSGMAKGIDAYAHTSCLKSGGRTIAFLANGLDICYPREHNVLMNAIMESGTVISEYPPGVRPNSYLFPRRNRLISAWSDEIIVIGAGRGSGAFITSEYAAKYGREIITT